MNTSIKTDDIIFNFFKQICDEKDDAKCVELGNDWINAMETNLTNMEANLDKKDKLDLYYKARKKLSEMYNSDKYRIEFKLIPKDLMMMDNYRLLHGRTAYETKEGNRFLQGCYIDYDSTEGKLRHLKRRYNL